MVESNKTSFSAAKLQDYLDCERRYELKYILEQSWPAIPSEPVLEIEENIRKGNSFHFLVHQYFSGISEDILKNSINDEDINSWFNSFLKFIHTLQIERSFSEFPVMYQFGSIQFSAVFDLIYSTKNGEIGIIDWKTSHISPRKSTLSLKIQSILYPFLLRETAHEFFPEIDLRAKNIFMRYWYPTSPQKEYIFPYDESIHEKNRTFLSSLADEILVKKTGEFSLTRDEKKCGYCIYRSLCNRGIDAANLLDLEENGLDEDNLTIDFDQLPELFANE